MRHFFRFTIPALFCLIVYGCSVVPAELKTAEQLIESHPDSALRILQGITPDKYQSDESRALYGLLLMYALDKNYLPMQPDSLLDFSISYYQKSRQKERLAACYFYKGRLCRYAFENEKAVAFYLKALDVAGDTNDNLLLGKLYNDLGYIYNIQCEYALARKKYLLALKYFTDARSYRHASYAVLGIGRSYHLANEHKKALYYYKKVYRQGKNPDIVGVACQETGTCYYNQKQYDSAIVYLREATRYPYIRNNRAIQHYYLADVFFDLNQLDSAWVHAKASFEYNPDIRTQRECYRILANTEYNRGNLKEMSPYMQQYVILSDSLRKIDTQTKGSVLETMHLTQRQAADTRNKLWYLLGLILIIILLGTWLYRRLQVRSKKIKKNLEHEKARLENEKSSLEDEKLQAEQIFIQQKSSIREEVMLKHRNSLIQKIAAKKACQHAERKKANAEKRDALDRKIYEELLHLNDTDFFYNEMNTVLNNLVTKLQTRYQGITDKEITWCCLYLLHIPLPDIYLLLDYKVDSLSKMKQRLALKVNLKGAGGINDLLHNLILEE